MEVTIDTDAQKDSDQFSVDWSQISEFLDGVDVLGLLSASFDTDITIDHGLVAAERLLKRN